jgi:DNA-binding response OmpR family regulator
LKSSSVCYPKTIVVITTGDINRTLAVEALRLNVDVYMVKPFIITNLLDRISYFIEKILSA